VHGCRRQELAEAMLFLASDVTGALLPLSGRV
jgi:hypothetical protein